MGVLNWRQKSVTGFEHVPFIRFGEYYEEKCNNSMMENFPHFTDTEIEYGVKQEKPLDIGFQKFKGDLI